MKKRIGIIGLGDIAKKAYLPILSQHQQVEIIGIMSAREATVDQVGEQYRIANRYTYLKAFLLEKPQAVFIHSPTETHYGIVMECLKNGVDVYVDKPLSYEMVQTLEMVKAAEHYGRLLCVGFNRRFAPRYQEAKQWLEDVGGLDLCIAQKHRIRQQESKTKQTIYDDLIHMLDLLIWLGCSSHGLSGYYVKEDEAGRLLHASGSLSWGGSTGFFSMNRAAGADMERLELHGNGRSVEVNDLEQATFYDKVTGGSQRMFGGWDSALYRRGFVGVVQHFLDSIDRPHECTIRADLVLPTHYLVEKLSL